MQIKNILLTLLAATSLNVFAGDVEKESNAQIKLLKQEIASLKKDVALLINNQQAIAAHVGLVKKEEAPKEQPPIPFGDSATLGSQDAELVLIEFTDLHCPFCKRFNFETMPKLKKSFVDKGELLFVGKHYPIVALHKNAMEASKALECARSQKSEDQAFYTSAKNWLFEQGSRFLEREKEIFVSKMSLDKLSFDSCMENPNTEATIQMDINLVRQLGLRATPAFAIGLKEGNTAVKWKTFEGAKSYENFTSAIEQIKQSKSE